MEVNGDAIAYPRLTEEMERSDNFCSFSRLILELYPLNFVSSKKEMAFASYRSPNGGR